MTLFRDPYPTLLLISDTEMHSIFLRHKLFEKYHVYTMSPKTTTPEDLRNMHTDVIVIDDENFSDKILPFCKELKQSKDLHFIPILVISSNLKKTYQESLKKAGVLDLLHEPLEEEELFIKLAHAKKYQEAHKKIDTLSPLTRPTNSQESLKKRVIFNKTDALKIQKAILKKEAITIIMVDSGPLMIPSSSKTYDLIIPLGSGVNIFIFNGMEAKKALLFAHEWQEAFSSPQVYMGVVSQDVEKEIFFPSLEEMIRVARQCLVEAKSGKEQIIYYLGGGE